MNIIHSRHEIRLAAPSTAQNAPDTEVWLAEMSDSAWRTLTDFRNWSAWIPQVQSVKQEDSEPPARGTKLLVDRGHRIAACTIERWDPPRSLQITIDLGGAEIAYGFLIETKLDRAEILLSLELERSLVGPSRLAAFFFRWRLERLGRQILANLAPRAKPANKL